MAPPFSCQFYIEIDTESKQNGKINTKTKQAQNEDAIKYSWVFRVIP
nr:MAG TPA: hypothetical protein [Caudoviricetes sp.]